MGARSRFHAPAFQVFKEQRQGERKFYTGTQKNRSAKFMFLWRDVTVIMCTERRGGRGDCGRDTGMSLTPNRPPASILVHRARMTRGAMARWRVDPARLIRPYTHSARVMSRTPTLPTYTLWHRSIGTRNRKARAHGNARKMLNRNAEREGKIEECGHKGTQRSTGMSALLWGTVLVATMAEAERNNRTFAMIQTKEGTDTGARWQ